MNYANYLEFQYHWSGDFYTALFQAISLADTENLYRLSMGFPDDVEAYKTWTRVGVQEFLKHIHHAHPLRKRFIKEYNLQEDTDVKDTE